MKKSRKTKTDPLSHQQESVLNLLFRAQTLLLNQLHTPQLVTIELAEGIDKLFQAYELVENPLSKMPICPKCLNVFYGKFDTYKYQCLSCGQELIKQ